MLENSQEFFEGDAKIAGNRLDKFGVENLPFMIRNRDPDILGVAENLMAARLSHLNKSKLMNDPDSLVSGEARNPRTHTASSRVVTLMDSVEGSG